MMSTRRVDALAFSRYVYDGLVRRACETEGVDGEYVWFAARGWLARLMAITDLPGELTEQERRTLDRLSSTVFHPDLSSDALQEWVDAFPDAVVRLFSESEVAAPAPELEDSLPVRPEDLEEAPVAGNRQSTLALAA
jgi:hypothetical protein